MADIPNPFDFRTSRFLRFSRQLRKSGKNPCLTKADGTGTAFQAFPSRFGTSPKGPAMHVDIITLQPLVALIFGILILILPRLLNYLIAIYLILVGLTGLFPHLFATSV
jgi:hypothetical protein